MTRHRLRAPHHAAAPILTLLITLIAAAGPASALAQTCPPHPLITDCTPAPAFQCPADQLGPFCPGEPPFLGSFGNGVLPSGNSLQIDQDCNGSTNGPADITVPIPAELQSLQTSCPTCTIQYRLTPSQDFLYATVFSNTQAVPGCFLDDVRVYFYAIDPGPTLTGFTGDQGACVPGPISDPPVFHDEPGYPNRTGILVGNQSAGAPVLWADLVGRQLNLDTFSYASGIQVPTFAPAGNAALLTSISGGTATEFALVDLCVSPFAGGGSVTTLAANGAVSGQVTGTTGALFAEVTHGAATTPIPLSDCVCGACCSGSSCTADVFASDCGGTFFPGASCSPDPCGGGGTDHALTVQVIGAGEVTSNIGGIDCPFVDCDADYSQGTVVTLTATPFAGRLFDSWSGDASGTNPTINVTMNADHTCIATFRDQQADLNILSVTPDANPLVAGTLAIYTIAVRNNGPEPVASFNFTATPPFGFTPDPNSSDPGCNFPGSFICTSSGTLAAGATRNVAVGFFLDPALRGDQDVQVNISGPLLDPDINNNQVTNTTPAIGIADLAITATVVPDPAPAGDLAVIQTSITNHGPSSATNIDIAQTLPADISLVDRDGNPIAGQPSPCTLADLALNGTNVAQRIVRLDNALPNGAQRTVNITVSADETDPVPANNNTTATITVGPGSSAIPRQRITTLVSDADQIPGGGQFSAFFDQRMDGDTVTFTASTTTSGGFAVGVYRALGTTITTVADSNIIGPRYPLPFESFASPVLDGLDLYFDGIFFNPFNVSGVYRQHQCGVDNLFISGDPAPGLGGQIAAPDCQAAVNGQLLFWNNGELLMWDAGAFTPIALRGELTPNGGGDTFTNMSSRSDFDGQTVVFQADSTTREGIYFSQGGALQKIVDTTDTRPDTGTPFDNFNAETSIDDGYIVFARDLGQAANPPTLYGYDIAAQQLDVIVGPNTPMPGGGRTFQYIVAPGINDGQRVLFPAYGPNFRGAGLYLWESGAIRRVLARLPSQALARDGFEGDRVVFREFSFFPPREIVIGQWGEPGDFDLDGVVDASDHAELLTCSMGPEVLLNFVAPATAIDCLSAFDADADDDLDMADLADFQTRLGP